LDEPGGVTDPQADRAAPDRGVVRRQAFLEAGRTVFLSLGYEAASVNDVVKIAGGSLATLYNQFGSKEGLFLAVFEDQYGRFIHDVTPANYEHLPIEEGLFVFGLQFFRAMMMPDHLAFFRLAVGGAKSHPKLVQRYLVSGLAGLRDGVIAYLRTATTPDGRKVANAEEAAGFLFDMLRARHHYRALASEEYRLSPEEEAEHVRQAVRLLLNGALPR
jgi:AcrR family transcriptional regulator